MKINMDEIKNKYGRISGLLQQITISNSQRLKKIFAKEKRDDWRCWFTTRKLIFCGDQILSISTKKVVTKGFNGNKILIVTGVCS